MFWQMQQSKQGWRADEVLSNRESSGLCREKEKKGKHECHQFLPKTEERQGSQYKNIFIYQDSSSCLFSVSLTEISP